MVDIIEDPGRAEKTRGRTGGFDFGLLFPNFLSQSPFILMQLIEIYIRKELKQAYAKHGSPVNLRLRQGVSAGKVCSPKW